MAGTMLDPRKLTMKERALRKKYIEDSIALKLEEFEQLKKEGEERFKEYQDGTTKRINRTFGVYVNIRRLLEEVTDLEDELEYITDVIKEEDEGEFVF